MLSIDVALQKIKGSSPELGRQLENIFTSLARNYLEEYDVQLAVNTLCDELENSLKVEEWHCDDCDGLAWERDDLERDLENKEYDLDTAKEEIESLELKIADLESQLERALSQEK